MKRLILSLILIATYKFIFAQVNGGTNVYDFLNFSSSARITSLGGSLITVKDDDVTLAWANPAALNPLMNHQVSFNHNFNFAGIQNGYLGYGHQLKLWGGITTHAALQYINYGKFDASDNLGNINGEFKASEYAFTAGASKQLYERLSIGANLKAITSRLESYNSFGLATDIAATFYDTSSRFTATLAFQNAGLQLSTYTDDNREPLPFNIQLGISKRLRYLPLRIAIIANQLQKWNIRYDDPNLDSGVTFLGENPTQKSDFQLGVDNFFRHMIFNAELLLGKKENIRLRVGYNHLRRKELSVTGYRSLAGFSAGVGIKINRFRLDYGFANYHIGGRVNHITISTDLDDFRKAKTSLN